MITTYLKGGCGNQMFQYATGLALARRLGTGLFINNSRYDAKNEFRMYSLGLFDGIKEQVVKTMPLPVIHECGMPYNPGLFEHVPQHASIDGYWQTEKYFKEIKEELCYAFLPKQHLSEQNTTTLKYIIQHPGRCVFVTVRRTDYVGNLFHGELPFQYYLAAVNYIAERIKDPIFFIFTDDLHWCKEYFNLGPYEQVLAGNYDRTVVPHLGREDAELFLMRSCHHAIMANSSYSWWGAWLGKADSDGIVIAPKNWFGPASNENPRDIVPERWIKL